MIVRTYSVSELRREIIEKLDTYIYLTLGQCLRVIDKRGVGKRETWERAMRRALRLTEQAGSITHGQVYEEGKNRRSGFATRRFVYYLTEQGAQQLAHLRTEATDAGIRVATAPHYQRRPVSLLHEIGITDFHITLAQAIRDVQHLRLHWIQRDTRRGTNPDAIFGIENTAMPRDRSTHWFFLEIELSRAGNWRNGESQKLRKAKRYDEYRRSHELTRDWTFIGDMRVIFHEETTERMVNVLKRFAPNLPYRFLWVTSKELITGKGVMSSVFYSPADYSDMSHSFAQLISKDLERQPQAGEC